MPAVDDAAYALALGDGQLFRHQIEILHEERTRGRRRRTAGATAGSCSGTTASASSTARGSRHRRGGARLRGVAAPPRHEVVGEIQVLVEQRRAAREILGRVVL